MWEPPKTTGGHISIKGEAMCGASLSQSKQADVPSLIYSTVMGKKDGSKKRKAEELAEDDENYVDPELQAEIAAVMAAREEARTSAENNNASDNNKEKTTYNKDGLIKSLESQPTEYLPFRETYQICENTILVQNENDDIEREMAFYNHTLQAVKIGRDKLEALGIPTIRPTDFFRESMKSDAHKTKIKVRLLIEAKRVESFELRKNREQNRKFNKQVSDLRKQEKSAERKQHNEELKKIKNAGDADEKEDRLNKVLGDHSEKSKKRQNMDKKYGFGAKDRKMAKLNDRK